MHDWTSGGPRHQQQIMEDLNGFTSFKAHHAVKLLRPHDLLTLIPHMKSHSQGVNIIMRDGTKTKKPAEQSGMS